MQKVRYWKIRTLIVVLMISFCWAAALHAQLPTDGLIAYYPFNGNTEDESGNGNKPTTAIVSDISDRCGFSSSACFFSGKYNYIALPPANFVGLNEYSYSLWFRADSVPPPTVDGWILFAVGSAADGHEQAFTFHSDAGLLGSGSNTGTNPSLTTVHSAPVKTGRWIHGVLTRDKTRMRIYIDGSLNDGISGSDSITNNQSANYGFLNQTATIGGRSDATSHEFFVGAIDEVRIYNRALNEEEIKQLYFTECTLGELVGPTEVCQGQQDVAFFVDPLNGAADYDWNYSGIGGTINGNGNHQITIDFSDNATSGTLTVTVTGDFVDAQTRSLAIRVNTLPLEAGVISGEPEVCQGDDGVIYQIPGIDNATSYNWSYSGNGVSYTGNSNPLSMDFAANATSGNLTVSGYNACGDGPASLPFVITVSQLPNDPGIITGESTVCQGQQDVLYSIPAIQNATDYAWNFSGTDVTLTEDANSAGLDFDSTATSGNLTVTGTNHCGNSTSPAELMITVLSAPAEGGLISGENAVCLNQTGVPYSVPVLQYSTNYIWEYSGTGATLTGNSNTITMDFSGQATGGNLTVTGQNNCGTGTKSPEFSIAVTDCSVDPVEIVIPNSFSPNGDGVNDMFVIRGLPENSTLFIFDRAGRKLFESNSYANDWDGKDRGGKELVSGTYWYVLSVSGIPEEYKGFVYLKR